MSQLTNLIRESIQPFKMNILKDVLKNEIVPKLDLKTLIKLKLTCTELFLIVNQNALDAACSLQVQHRLQQVFEDQYDQFIAELDRSGAVISGSFIIQCILGECWEQQQQQDDKNGDIDIYVDVKDKFDQTGEWITSNPTTQFESWFFDNFFFRSVVDATQYQEVSNFIVWIREFAFPKKGVKIPKKNYLGMHWHHKFDQDKPILQIIDLDFDPKSYHRFDENGKFISVDQTSPTIQTTPIPIPPTPIPNDDIWEFVKLTFDLDICKNIFGVKDHVPYIKTYRLNQIVTKTSTYTIPPDRELSTEERIHKYVKRGFKFI